MRHPACRSRRDESACSHGQVKENISIPVPVPARLASSIVLHACIHVLLAAAAARARECTVDTLECPGPANARHGGQSSPKLECGRIQVGWRQGSGGLGARDLLTITCILPHSPGQRREPVRRGRNPRFGSFALLNSLHPLTSLHSRWYRYLATRIAIESLYSLSSKRSEALQHPLHASTTSSGRGAWSTPQH